MFFDIFGGAQYVRGRKGAVVGSEFARLWRYWVATVSRIDKLYVACAECSLFDRALLQKRPMILSILLTEATP